GRQEVSGYGADDGSGNVSDTGDNWKVECTKSNASEYWLRNPSTGRVSFVHTDTGNRFYTARQSLFDQNNCRGCPIVGQLEVSADKSNIHDANALWTAEDGIYFPVNKNIKQ